MMIDIQLLVKLSVIFFAFLFLAFLIYVVYLELKKTTPPLTHVLKRCPFCGFQPDRTNDDCVYPACRPDINENGEVYYRVWQVVCYETGGGCGASTLGGSKEDAINNWNKRY